MRKTLRQLCLLLLGLVATVTSHQAKASHAIGSDMNYVNVAPGIYFVSYRFYRDCSGISAPTSFTLNYRATGCGPTGTGTNAGSSLTLARRGFEDGNPYCGRINQQSPCDSTGSTPSLFPNYQVYTYSALLNLGTGPNEQCSDWVLSTQLNARPAVANIPNSDFEDLFSFARLNNRDLQDDSSPSFSIAQGFKPLIFVCDSSTNRIGNAVIDPDGDSLVFSLAPAYVDAVGPGTQGQATYGNGFTFTNPVRVLTGTVGGQPSLPFTLDSRTGEISFTAGNHVAGSINEEDNKFVVVVQVDAYRRINGQVVRTGTVRRDILVVIFNCNGLPQPPIVPGGDSSIVNTGVDTLYYAAPNDTLTVDACNSTRIEIPIFDRNRDSVYIDIDQRQLPGGAVIRLIRSSFTGSISRFTAQLTWTPDQSTVGGYYQATLNIRDNGCPLPARTTQNLILHVIRNQYADVGLAGSAATRDTLCVGEQTTMVATTQRPATIGFPPQAANYTYVWHQDADSTIYRINGDSAYVRPLRTTRYLVDVVSPVGCIDTASIVIPVAPLADTLPAIPTVRYLFGTNLQYGQTYSFDPNFTTNAVPNLRAANDPDGTIFKYRIRGMNLEAFSDTTSTTPLVRNLSQTTTFTLAQISSGNCTTYRRFTIEVPLQIWNVITPNGDGLNDTFVVQGAKEPEVMIFNRWGKKIEEWSAYDNKWNGGDLSAGTYYYHVKDKEQNKTYKGWFQIVR